jgi:hypothetical protein
MCLRLVFGYGEEDLERARQGVVNALRRGLLRWAVEPVSEAEGLVREVVAGVSAGEVEEWAEGVGQGLRRLVEQLVVRLGAQAARIEALEREREGLRRQLAAYEAEAPVERLRAVVAERDEWRGEAVRLRERVRALEGMLAGAEERHREEVGRLREEVAALNRIIVEQQEALNAVTGRKRREAAPVSEEEL